MNIHNVGLSIIKRLKLETYGPRILSSTSRDGVVWDFLTKDKVLKVQRHGWASQREVDVLLRLNSVKPRLAPRIHKYGRVGKFHYILMDNLFKMYPLAAIELFKAHYRVKVGGIRLTKDELNIKIPLLVKRAMGKLHSLGISHGDAHGSNIFVVRDKKGKLSVKLIDFGMSAFYPGISKLRLSPEKKRDLVQDSHIREHGLTREIPYDYPYHFFSPPDDPEFKTFIKNQNSLKTLFK